MQLTEREEQLVAWLKETRGSQLSLRNRLWLAWMALRHGEMVYYASRVTVAEYIERGTPWKGQ